jgi:hypothetical protein
MLQSCPTTLNAAPLAPTDTPDQVSSHQNIFFKFLSLTCHVDNSEPTVGRNSISGPGDSKVWSRHAPTEILRKMGGEYLSLFAALAETQARNIRIGIRNASDRVAERSLQ